MSQPTNSSQSGCSSRILCPLALKKGTQFFHHEMQKPRWYLSFEGTVYKSYAVVRMPVVQFRSLGKLRTNTFLSNSAPKEEGLGTKDFCHRSNTSLHSLKYLRLVSANLWLSWRNSRNLVCKVEGHSI